MLDLHTSIALRELLTKADVRGKWRTGETYLRHRPMYIYTSRHELDELITQKKPISAIIRLSNISETVASICCHNSDGNINLYDVNWDDDGEYKCGMWYSAMTIAVQPSGTRVELTHMHELVHDYAMLCAGIDHYYCAITKNWLVRNECGQYSVPKLCEEIFI